MSEEKFEIMNVRVNEISKISYLTQKEVKCDIYYFENSNRTFIYLYFLFK